MATDRTTAALELALRVLAAVENADMFVTGDVEMPGHTRDIRDQIEGALASIGQQPVQIGSAALAIRLRQELTGRQ